MKPNARLRKNLNLYEDFPFLWAVDPRCDTELDIKVVQLDGAYVGAGIAPGTEWWMRLVRPDTLTEIQKIEPAARENLAAAILRTVGLFAVTPSITHLVSRERTENGRAMTVHRPLRVGLDTIPILHVCRNRAATS